MNFWCFYEIFFCQMTKSIPQRMKKLVGVLLTVSFCGSESAIAQSPIENIEQLRQNAARFLTDEYQNTHADKIEVKIGGLDPRLRLAQCDQPLNFVSQDSSGNGGNINIQVNCKGSTRWTILVPAQATIFRSIAVASHNLQRGQIVSDADVDFSSVEMSQYKQGFALQKQDILGKEIRYPVNKGDTFRSSVLDAPLAIKRGDEVTIEAASGSIRVVTNGTAVSDGRIGQQIRVKNNQSERVINARVLESGKVQTIL